MRALLTMLGTVVGVGTLVTVLGLTTTARQQISAEFDEFAATEVRLRQADAAGVSTYPEDLDARIRRLPGIVAYGETWPIDQETSQLRGTLNDETASDAGLPVVAATPGAVEVFGLTVTKGRAFDAFHQDRAERVVLLSDAAANRLGVVDVDRQPAVVIGEQLFTVIGIYNAAERHPEVLLGAIVPTSTSAEHLRSSSGAPSELVIETRPGAAGVVADLAAVSIRPDRPESIVALAPPDPRQLRGAIDRQVARLFTILAFICVAIGGFGIANTMLVGVLERVPEIGLRRAIGARRGSIAAQFLTESTFLGTLGGVIGAAAGFMALAAVAVANGWTATVDPNVVAAPLLGTATGLVAGLYPAVRASRIQPADALRR